MKEVPGIWARVQSMQVEIHFAVLHQSTSNAASGNNNVKVNIVNETSSEQVSKLLFLETVLCQDDMYVHVAVSGLGSGSLS